MVKRAEVHLAVLMVQVQRAAGIINRTVLPGLNGEAQLRLGQVAQGAGLGLAASAHAHHQGRVACCVSRHLARMAQQQCLHDSALITPRKAYEGGGQSGVKS